MKRKAFAVMFVGVAFVVLICGAVVLWQRVRSLEGQVDQLRDAMKQAPRIEPIVEQVRQSDHEQRAIEVFDFPEISVADARWDVERAMIIDANQQHAATLAR